ncbi:unnamed protein product [Prunus brigantina]
MVSSYEAPSRYPKGQVSSCHSVNMSSRTAEPTLSVCPFGLYLMRRSEGTDSGSLNLSNANTEEVEVIGERVKAMPAFYRQSHVHYYKKAKRRRVTKSKCIGHRGWVQANCLRASERGHFMRVVPTSQKLWRNQRVLLSGD